jgi:hypothetical protein
MARLSLPPNPRKRTPDCFKHSKDKLRKAIDERNHSYNEASNRTNDERLKHLLREKWARLRKVVQHEASNRTDDERLKHLLREKWARLRKVVQHEASNRTDDERLKHLLREKWARLQKVVRQAKQRWVIKMAEGLDEEKMKDLPREQ